MSKFNVLRWSMQYMKDHPELDMKDPAGIERVKQEAHLAEAQFVGPYQKMGVGHVVHTLFWGAMGLIVVGLIAVGVVSCVQAKVEEHNRTPAQIAAAASTQIAAAASKTQQAAPIGANGGTAQPNQLIDRCAAAAVEAGFRSASCADYFMTVCVTTESRSAMAQAVALGDMNGVINGSKYAQCGGGAFTPSYGQAFELAVSKSDKF